VAQDGTRVRASAGSASFRRKRTLERCLKEARAHLARLAREAEQQNSAPSARIQAARQRAAREQAQRIEQALAELELLRAARAQAKNHPQRAGEARASTTDPAARVMKLGNGGFGSAYNLQFATDTDSRIIVGVGATNAGVDSQQLEPMQEQIERRTKAIPRQHLADGGYLNFAAIEHSARRGIEVFSPLRANRSYTCDPLKPQPGDSPAIADYRRRMASPEGQAIYQQRAATAETVNADLKTWRGLDRLLAGLGIHHVGSRVAHVLASQFGSLDALAAATRDELSSTHEIGDVIAESVHDFFHNQAGPVSYTHLNLPTNYPR